MSDRPAKNEVRVSLHGPGASIDDALSAATATTALLDEIARTMGDEGGWKVTSVFFQCDGCGLKRPDRPGPDEGWTYREPDDLCPACSGEAA